ncbi:MAG: SMP-30/gluconolactonase/LRE family protein, partial [Pseudolysinimonas sp.]
MTLVVATEESFDLSEGPLWDPIRERLLWVDIRTGTVLSGTLNADGTITTLDRVSFPGTVGAVAVSEAGDWIVAGAEEILVRQPTGEIVLGPRIVPPASGRRLNDGKPDPLGRFLVGTCRPDDGPTVVETLSVVQPDGRVEVLDDDLTLSNGLGWSPDFSTMYSIDTVAQVVNSRPFDPVTGAFGPRRVFLKIDEGYPDGMCVDVEGHLWIAIWSLGQVRRYSPVAELVRVIDVPAPNTSCVAFAGPDLATMVITTATKDLGPEARAQYPLSGHLFTLDPGVRGLPANLWSG